MNDQVSIGPMMLSIMTQRGRNSMSNGTAIRVIVCRMMRTKLQGSLFWKWRKSTMLRIIQIMWTDRKKSKGKAL